MALALSELRAVGRVRSPVRRRVGTGHVGLAGEILVAYLKARCALTRAPITTVVANLRKRPAQVPRAANENHLAEARRLGSAVLRTLALVPGDTRCLVRSVVLAELLARRGIPAKLVIGARSDPVFLAHAWVEHTGCPVLPPGDGSFGRLVEL